MQVIKPKYKKTKSDSGLLSSFKILYSRNSLCET